MHSKIYLFILSLVVVAQAFAQSDLDPTKSFTCTDKKNGKLTVSVPNAAGARNAVHLDKPMTFTFCADTTANNKMFGVKGGELGCFDSKLSPKIKLEIVLSTGESGKAGDFKLESLIGGFQPITGVCKN